MALALAAAAAAAAAETPPAAPPSAIPSALGGALSRAAGGRDSFALPAPFLAGDRLERFFAGQRLFNIAFVPAPSAVVETQGLGPTFNRPSCAACHAGDGRGAPPKDAAEALNQMVVRLATVERAPVLRFAPHRRYGGQLNERAIEGVPAEGFAEIAWVEAPGAYADGTRYSLRRPRLALKELAFGILEPDTHLSPRVAPQLVGLGLLEAIREADILAHAETTQPDRVQGQPAREYDAAAGRFVLGRFGWRGERRDVRDQIAAALIGDMGITNPLHAAQNCPPIQRACRAAPAGPQPEFSAAQLDTLVFYVSTLAVPARRAAEAPETRRGERLFFALGCDTCHRPRWTTGPHAIPELARQTIHPFTDLLLHDLGADLADETVGGAPAHPFARLWRTAPLWGLGLVESVNGHLLLLHDGRARGFAEAILWHGGAAEPARERFRALPAADRDALVAFLRSL
jgi:CxxC motif-containing protein (DUF1111 family)